MSERTYSEVMDDFRHHIAVDESVATDPEDIFAIVARINKGLADGLDAAHKREIDVLKQRCAELNAEVAAKDEVIKRLNDAIAEEQRRKMATAENSSAVGNAAKLREALEFIKQYFDKIDPFNINTYTFSQIEVEHINEAIDAALAAPPRNCDVGTAEEQSKRKLKFCYKPGGCANCPFSKSATLTHCALAWAHMPYEEGGAK